MARSHRRRARLGWLSLTFACISIAGTRVSAQDSHWPQFRGPNVDGISIEQDVFPEDGQFSLAVGWKATIGEGVSGVAVANGVVVTMAQRDDRQWVIALDTETGEKQWRYELAPAYYSPNGTYHGPFSTPLVTETAVIALGRNGRLVGLDVLTGDLVWSTDLPSELNVTPPEHGFATSPVLVDGMLIVQTGAANAAIGAFDPETGTQLWAVGGDQVYYQTPVPVRWRGRRELIAAGQTHVMGIEPASGTLLWQYAHHGDGFTGHQSLVPVAAGEGRVFLANKHHSSSLVRLDREAGITNGHEVWEQRTIRNSFAVPVYYEGYLYGYSSRFLVCVDAHTGEAVWRSRPPGDGWLILVDGHLVIVTKDGSLHVAKASPEGYEELESLQLFDDPSWTHPSFAGGHIYARSYAEVVRVDIRSAARLTEGGIRETDPSLPQGRFAQFLTEVADASDKTPVVDRFIESIPQFPFVETDTRVHFIYRGPADDVAIAGDLIGARIERPMTRVEGTNLFYHSVELDPAARANYHFIRDYEEITDPRNPRTTTTMVYGPDMEVLYVSEPMTVSWMSMPRWQSPTHLRELTPGRPRGRLVRHEVDSAALGGMVAVHVYLPDGYADNEVKRYPVAYYHDGAGALARGQLPTSLDNLVGREVRPIIAVFVEPALVAFVYGERYVNSLVEEIVPFIDSAYRTIARPEGRASVGGGFMGVSALDVGLLKPDVFGKVAAQSVYWPSNPVRITQLVRTPAEQPLDLYIEWGTYDVQSPAENWDMGAVARAVFEALVEHGHSVAGGEVPDGAGWSSWQNRTDRVLRTLFPIE